MKALMQPFPDPFLLQKPAGVHLRIAEGEFLPGLHIQRAWRQIRSALTGRQQLGIEGQSHPMGITVTIGSRQLHQPYPRPIGWPFVKQVIAVGMGFPYPQKRHRQPRLIEDSGCLSGVQRIDLLRLDRLAVVGDELAAGIICVQARQDCPAFGSRLG